MKDTKSNKYNELATNLDVARVIYCEALLQTEPHFRVTTDEVVRKFKCSVNSARNSLLSYRRINGECVTYYNRSGELRAGNKFTPVVSKGIAPEAVLSFIDALTDVEVVAKVKGAKSAPVEPPVKN